jgi:hypothetical protein
MIRYAVIAVFCCWITLASAQDYEAGLQKAGAYIKEERFAEAIDELKVLIERLQARIADELIAAFPEPLDGWERGEVVFQQVGMSVFGGGLSLTAEYTGARNHKIDIQIITKSPMIEGLAVVLQNSEISAPEQELIQFDDYKGLLRLQSSAGQGDIKMIIGTETLVTITARDFSDSTLLRATLLDYADALLSSEIPRIAGNKQ